MKLDVLANEIFVRKSEWGGQLAGMLSEEMEQPFQIPAEYPRGRYLLLFDPLDGSSNIDVNVSVGRSSPCCVPRGRRASRPKRISCSPGAQQVCAGYAIYGPATMLVLSAGQGVNGFTLDREIGEFMLTHPNLRMPEETSEFAINASNARHWEPAIRRYVNECLAGKSGPRGRDFNMRWIASHGGRDASHPDARRRVHVSARPQGSEQGRAAAAALRGQSDGDAHRAGRRRAQHRARAASLDVAAEQACTSACRSIFGARARGRAHRALPPRATTAPISRSCAAVQRALAVPPRSTRLTDERDTHVRQASRSSPSPAPRAPAPPRSGDFRADFRREGVEGRVRRRRQLPSLTTARR